MPRVNVGPAWMLYSFPAVSGVLALIAVYFPVRAGASPALFVLPVAVAGLTYAGLRRFLSDKALPSTVHHYALFAPSASGPTLGRLLERLGAHGYELEANTLDDAGNVGPRPGHALDIVGNQIRIVDHRGRPDLGMIALRLRQGEEGELVGLVEASDTGPGVYDEMAQFAIVELAALIPGLQFAALARGPDRRDATALREELPEKPLGLALL